MDQETSTNESSRAVQPLRQPGYLPSEILAQILLLTLPPPSEPQARQLEVLSLVCRFWHLIVDSTPALWSGISITDNISHVEKALSKSGEHPIDVCGDRVTPASDWRRTNDKSPSTMFLAKVQRHVRQWRHVTLDVPPLQGSTPTFTILPWLRTLELQSWKYSVLSDQFFVMWNRQQAPFLQELSLNGLQIARLDLTSLPPTLSKLQISRMKVEYPLIVGWLSAIAACCPRLAVFRLWRVSTDPGDGVMRDENNAPAVVELNALRWLGLDHLHPDLIIDFLKRLRLPKDCGISIGCSLQSPNPSTSFLSPALSTQGNFQRAGKIIEVTITLTERPQDVVVVYKRFRIFLNLPGPWAIRNALDWLGISGEDSNDSSPPPGGLDAGLVRSNNNAPITLQIDQNWLRRNFVKLRMISDLRNINRIEIDTLTKTERRAFLFYLSAPEDRNQPPRKMGDYLRKPKPESNQEVEGVWPFPGLSELVRKEPDDEVVYRVLLEPIGGQSSDDAAAGTSRRAKRSELPEPKTPWEAVE